MKLKKGFTLAELLIALGITAMVAALMAAAFSQVKPDKTKMLYLKGYDTLTQSVKMLVNSSTIYGPVYVVGNKTYDVSKCPLLNLDAPLNTSFNGYQNNDNLKFGRLLAEMVNGTNGTASGTSSYSFDSGPGKFHWTVTPQGTALSASTGNTVNFCNHVTLSIDNKNFNFCVKPDGVVQILDVQGQTYVNNRKNVRSRNDVTAQASSVPTSCSVSYPIADLGNNYYKIDGEASPNPNPPVTPGTPSTPGQEQNGTKAD